MPIGCPGPSSRGKKVTSNNITTITTLFVHTISPRTAMITQIYCWWGLRLIVGGASICISVGPQITGEEEAKQQVADGTVLCRDHPRCKGAKQFKLVVEWSRTCFVIAPGPYLAAQLTGCVQIISVS